MERAPLAPPVAARSISGLAIRPVRVARALAAAALGSRPALRLASPFISGPRFLPLARGVAMHYVDGVCACIGGEHAEGIGNSPCLSPALGKHRDSFTSSTPLPVSLPCRVQPSAREMSPCNDNGARFVARHAVIAYAKSPPSKWRFGFFRSVRLVGVSASEHAASPWGRPSSLSRFPELFTQQTKSRSRSGVHLLYGPLYTGVVARGERRKEGGPTGGRPVGGREGTNNFTWPCVRARPREKKEMAQLRNSRPTRALRAESARVSPSR